MLIPFAFAEADLGHVNAPVGGMIRVAITQEAEGPLFGPASAILLRNGGAVFGRVAVTATAGCEGNGNE